jgi:hypothetical protein
VLVYIGPAAREHPGQGVLESSRRPGRRRVGAPGDVPVRPDQQRAALGEPGGVGPPPVRVAQHGSGSDAVRDDIAPEERFAFGLARVLDGAAAIVR